MAKLLFVANSQDKPLSELPDGAVIGFKLNPRHGLTSCKSIGGLTTWEGYYNDEYFILTYDSSVGQYDFSYVTDDDLGDEIITWIQKGGK